MVIRFGRYGLFVWPMWLWPIWFVADMVVADMVCGRYGTDPHHVLLKAAAHRVLEDNVQSNGRLSTTLRHCFETPFLFFDIRTTRHLRVSVTTITLGR